MLKDLRSIKLRPRDRDHVNRIRSCFESAGSVVFSDERWLHDVCRRYSVQIQELHASRERAIKTNALKSMGLSREEAQRRVEARNKLVEKMNDDMGF